MRNNYEKSYNTMKGEVISTLKRILPNSILVEEIKNIKNGQVLEGVSLRREDENIALCFYFNHFLEAYMDGIPVELISEKILELYKEAIKEQRKININNIEDFEKQKENIIFKIVNTEKNRELLNNAPYFPLLDLSIIFSLKIDVPDCEGIGTMNITNQLMELWEVDKRDLLELALVNTPKLLPIEIGYVTELLLKQEINEVNFDEILDSISETQADDLIYLRNKSQINGFSVLLYPDILKKLHNKIGSFYIIPSSIHEALLLPWNDNVDIDYMRNLIQEVNENLVNEVEFLSDNLYFYNKETQSISIC